MQSFSDDESDSESSISVSSLSFDDDEVNIRVCPNWCSYRRLIQYRGFRLDTCRDVKQYYQQYWERVTSRGCNVSQDWPGYLRACEGRSDDDLCKDVGLPENLFRGTRCADGLNIVVKAIHLCSREYETLRYLSSPPLCKHPMNHCIPILDFIEIPQDSLVLVIMEEWSPYLVSDSSCTLRDFLGTMRQHLEHITFMHNYNIAHLDISLHNILTDDESRYACIDFETSRRFSGIGTPRIRAPRAAELPPEVEEGGWSDPYKIDIWASGMLILRAAKMTGNDFPELSSVVSPMLRDAYEQRPTAKEALASFDAMVCTIRKDRLDSYGSCQ